MRILDMWAVFLKLLFDNELIFICIVMEVMALVFVLVFVLAILVVMIWTIVDIARAEFPDNMKLVWILVVLLGGIIGMVVYFVVGRKQKLNEGGIDRKYVKPGENPFDQ